jgi:hypothetical protein
MFQIKQKIMSNEFSDNFEDFEENLDPVERVKLEETYQAEIETAMREAYRFIEDLGEENWLKSNQVPLAPDRKKKILTNMIEWFAKPEREEYEKSAKLKRILDRI